MIDAVYKLYNIATPVTEIPLVEIPVVEIPVVEKPLVRTTSISTRRRLPTSTYMLPGRAPG
jgi:hypothetical protein